MIDDINQLLSPFRVSDEPSMYQTLPNISKEDDVIRPTPSKPAQKPKTDDDQKIEIDKEKETEEKEEK